MTQAKPTPLPGDEWFAKPGRYIEEDRGHSTPCWIWQASLKFGYGQVMISTPSGKVLRRAHRVYYERANGPLDASARIELHHECGIRSCVNPAHLTPLTPLDHARRHPNKGRRLTAEQVVEIRASSESGSTLAARFGVNQSTIVRIKQRRTYAEVAA